MFSESKLYLIFEIPLHLVAFGHVNNTVVLNGHGLFLIIGKGGEEPTRKKFSVSRRCDTENRVFQNHCYFPPCWNSAGFLEARKDLQFEFLV